MLVQIATASPLEHALLILSELQKGKWIAKAMSGLRGTSASAALGQGCKKQFK